MAEFDTIIRGGTVVDGTRVPRYRADLGIKNGKIAKIGRLPRSEATQVLDATGLIVAPGFITCTPITTPSCTGTRTARSAAGMG